eukprot:comp11822_c0_seq1/m.6445 comp11822_c0_seq1/g.6445  ORF comp11822_c0_seq1/g.6445 comp11822_c0_seq1/m.6445 type:complete len:603 (-) comp11822_c0_seq1:17-1825(-)
MSRRAPNTQDGTPVPTTPLILDLPTSPSFGQTRLDNMPPGSPGGSSRGRSNSAPSIYEVTDDETGEPLAPPHTRAARSKSFGDISPRPQTFRTEMLRIAHMFNSTSVYEHVDYNESDAEWDEGSGSDAYGYEDTDHEDEETKLVKKPVVTYGAQAAKPKTAVAHKGDVLEGKEMRGNNKKKTVFTIFKAFIASGILFLPHGYMLSGWALANIILAIVGFLATYAMHLLLHTKAKLVADGKRVLSFGDIAYYAFGSWGRWAVEVAIFGSQMGFCCAYFAFVGENVHSVIFALADCLAVDKIFIMICLIPVLVPMVWVRRLTYYAITNIIADILIVVPLIYMAITESKHIQTHGIGPNVVAFNWSTFLPFFGTTVYGLEGISMILPIEQAMKEKEKLPMVLNACMLFIVGLMATFGTLSYFTFGDQTASIITLNLGEGPEDNIVVSTIKLAYCVAIIFTFPLMMFPNCKIVERKLFKHERHSGRKWSKNVTRLLLVLICFCIAVVGSDQVDSFVSIVGALCCTPLAFIFPAIFHWKICCTEENSPIFFNHSYRRLMFAYVVDLAIAAFGTLAMFLATGIAISQWINAGAPHAEQCAHEVRHWPW